MLPKSCQGRRTDAGTVPLRVDEGRRSGSRRLGCTARRSCEEWPWSRCRTGVGALARARPRARQPPPRTRAPSGLIESAGAEPSARGPARRLMSATPAGRRAVATWLQEPVRHVRDLPSALLLELLFRSGTRADTSALLRAQRGARADGGWVRGPPPDGTGLRTEAGPLEAGVLAGGSVGGWEGRWRGCV